MISCVDGGHLETYPPPSSVNNNKNSNDNIVPQLHFNKTNTADSNPKHSFVKDQYSHLVYPNILCIK